MGWESEVMKGGRGTGGVVAGREITLWMKGGVGGDESGVREGRCDVESGTWSGR